MHLSPAQEFHARNALTRLWHARGTLPANRPQEVAVRLEELECLALAAAPAMGIDPDQFDRGKWHGGETPAAPAQEPRPEWHIPT
jgi:hypothetical protein